MAKLTWKIWLLIIVLALSILAINPSFKKGVEINSVEQNSTARDSGLQTGQIIEKVNNQEIKTLEDYSKATDSIFNTESNQSQKITIITSEGEHIIFTNKPPEITLKEIPSTRINLGLDLQGGSRALVQPDEKISLNEINDLIDITKERFNVYGLKDIVIRQVSDLSGENYMLVEIAGATPSDLENLIAEQGKFEAKIGNRTVFVGGNQDITHVSTSGQTAGIESCSTTEGLEVCRFRFGIYLSEEAAQKHADITSTLDVDSENPEYLSEKLDLYVDGVLLDSLFISKDLKGSQTTQISIQGSGTGVTRKEAIENTQANMKKLQTILKTGSLPYKLNIVKLDTISPVLGKTFLRAILIAAFSAIFAVSLVVLIRYRKIKSSLALLLTSFSEIIIILGIAAMIKWNLDLPSIAGILAVIGTGVDQQIVILDESHLNRTISIKERIKRALFIIVGSYATTFFAMLPLLFAGAGLLRGFAVTTLIGITTGVLITRPAFADIIKKIEE